MKQWVASLTVVLFFTCTVALRVPSTSETGKVLFLTDVLKALEKVNGFFLEDYENLNVDGLFTARLGQGILVGTIDDCVSSGFHCPPELIDRLRFINDQLSDAGVKALPYIQQQNEVYYNQYLPTLIAPYFVNYIPEKLVGAPEEIFDNSISYNGLYGDYCFSNMIGTNTDEGRLNPVCTIPDECWQFMTRKGTVGYYTTHQLLYSIYAQHTGCQDVVEERAQRLNCTSVRDLQKYFCQMILADATFRIKNWKMESFAEDLFLEQIALCGALGYQNFLNETWIRMAISWQTPRGCFTIAPTLIKLDKQRMKISEAIKHLLAMKEQGHINQATEDNIETQLALLEDELNIAQLAITMEYNKINAEQNTIPTRKLMTEHYMDGNCLSHKTGLGFAALAVTVRSLVGELYGGN